MVASLVSLLVVTFLGFWWLKVKMQRGFAAMKKKSRAMKVEMRRGSVETRRGFTAMEKKMRATEVRRARLAAAQTRKLRREMKQVQTGIADMVAEMVRQRTVMELVAERGRAQHAQWQHAHGFTTARRRRGLIRRRESAELANLPRTDRESHGLDVLSWSCQQ